MASVQVVTWLLEILPTLRCEKLQAHGDSACLKALHMLVREFRGLLSQPWLGLRRIRRNYVLLARDQTAITYHTLFQEGTEFPTPRDIGRRAALPGLGEQLWRRITDRLTGPSKKPVEGELVGGALVLAHASRAADMLGAAATALGLDASPLRRYAEKYRVDDELNELLDRLDKTLRKGMPEQPCLSCQKLLQAVPDPAAVPVVRIQKRKRRAKRRSRPSGSQGRPVDEKADAHMPRSQAPSPAVPDMPMTQAALCAWIADRTENSRCSEETIRQAARQAGIQARTGHSQLYSPAQILSILKNLAAKYSAIGRACKRIVAQTQN